MGEKIISTRKLSKEYVRDGDNALDEVDST